MSSVPWKHLGIDLNEAVRDPDLDDDLGVDLKQPLWHNVADVYLCNPADPNDMQVDLFDELNNHVRCHAKEEDQEEVPCEPDLNEANACQKETPTCCEPDLNLNESTNSGQVVLLPDLNEIPGEDGALGTSRKQYSDDTKRAVYAMLLEGSQGGRLPVGLTLQLSSAMDVSLRCVQQIRKAAQKGGGIHAVVSKKAKSGRKRVEVNPEAMTAIPLKDRTTLENVAKHPGMAKSTIFRRIKEGRIERHSIAMHSLFSNEDKMYRAQYSLDKLGPQSSSSSCFQSNYNVTHMVENGFIRQSPFKSSIAHQVRKYSKNNEAGFTQWHKYEGNVVAIITKVYQ